MKIQENNYYVVQGWMRTSLGLSGNELHTFAIIWGFCQDGTHLFNGSLAYICDWLGVKSKHTVIKAIDGLINKGYVRKELMPNHNGYLPNTYSVNFDIVQKMAQHSAKNDIGVVQNLTYHSAKNDINNYIDNNENKNNENNIIVSAVANTPYQEIIERYNSICVSLPKVKIVSQSRKDKIKGMWKFFENDMNQFLQLFSMAEESDFLTGRDGVWQSGINFDWLMNKTNATKVLEGTYVNKNIVKRKNDTKKAINSLYEELGMEGEQYDTVATKVD